MVRSDTKGPAHKKGRDLLPKLRQQAKLNGLRSIQQQAQPSMFGSFAERTNVVTFSVDECISEL